MRIVIVLAIASCGHQGASTTDALALDPNPIACQATLAGEGTGVLSYAGATATFGPGVAANYSYGTDMGGLFYFDARPSGGTVALEARWDASSLPLQPKTGTYTMATLTNDPFQVTSPSTSGTLVVDEVTNCFAGRFLFQFESNAVTGEVAGWFVNPCTPVNANCN